MDPLTDLCRDALIDRIGQVWRSVLNIDDVGTEENFFDLGGNSFQLLRMKDRLDTDLGMSTDLVSFFRYPTVAQLADNVYGAAR
jgi:acyl carrier protein